MVNEMCREMRGPDVLRAWLWALQTECEGVGGDLVHVKDRDSVRVKDPEMIQAIGAESAKVPSQTLLR